MTKDQILTEAMSLDAADREALAEQLFLSVGQSDAETIASAWLQEVRAGDALFVAGKMKASPIDDVIDR